MLAWFSGYDPVLGKANNQCFWGLREELKDFYNTKWKISFKTLNHHNIKNKLFILILIVQGISLYKNNMGLES